MLTLTERQQLPGVRGEQSPNFEGVLTAHDMGRIVITPALTEVYAAAGSTAIYKADEISAQITIGDWFKYKLRDRSSDGPGWKTSPLTDWHYDHPDDRFPLGSAVEESTYWLDPRYPITDVFADEAASFISNPFDALPYSDPTPEALQVWHGRWQEVVSHDQAVYPGFYSLKAIPELRRHILETSKDILKTKGYQYLTAIPTWFHTAKMYEHLGFSYIYESDAEAVAALSSRLPFTSRRERVESSWMVMRQFWAHLAETQGYVPEELAGDATILRDDTGNLLTYPLTMERNLWMYQEVA